MDPENKIVQLCAQGMQAEGDGRMDDAAALFMKAWDNRTNDYDACIAAHFVARHQETSEETLFWNQLSLNHAEIVGDESVEGFYPSLYLNMGNAYEKMGNREEAERYYAMAAERAKSLPDDRYGSIVKDGIERGRQRINKEE